MPHESIPSHLQSYRYHVYLHVHEGGVFYVGVGTQARPFHTQSRSAQWRAFVAHCGTYAIGIVHSTNNKQEAHRIEASLIREYHPACNVRGKRSRTTHPEQERHLAHLLETSCRRMEEALAHSHGEEPPDAP